MSLLKHTTLAALTALALAAAPALAADTQLSPNQVKEKLEAAGYTNVHDIEFDDGRYEAEATSKSGQAVDLEIDPATGAVTSEQPD